MASVSSAGYQMDELENLYRNSQHLGGHNLLEAMSLSDPHDEMDC
jgi:hypothetical protein